MTYKPEYSKIVSDVNNIKNMFLKELKRMYNLPKAKVKEQF